MCRFPYLAVQLRDDMFDGHDPRAPVARIAKHRHALRVEPIEPRGTLARFAEGMDLVATFEVNHCACDWGPTRHEALAALTRDLLSATDVRRVRVGLWTIRGSHDHADPYHRLEIREIDTDALADVDWRGDVALEVRRAPHSPFPTRPLRKIALG